MKQYPVQTITIPRGETIAYRSCGQSGPVVLLIHGNMSSSVHWQTTMEQLEADYRVYAPDMRGFGDSTYNARFDSLHELALDLEEFADGVGIGKFAAVGWSTGGGVALEMAADWPQRVQKVVLLDSVPVTGYPMYKKDAEGKPIPDVLLKTKEEIEQDPVQVAPVLAAYATNNRELMRIIWNASIYNLRQPPAEEYELYLDAIMQQRNLVDIDYSLLTFNMTDRATGSAPGSGRAALVQCPVVVMQGEKDLVVPAAWGKTIVEDLGGRATYVSFPEAGHSAITDIPEGFFSALRASLTP